MRTLAIVTLAGVALAAAASATEPPARAVAAAAPRPLVLLVHGRGQLGRDTASLRLELTRALQRGATAATGAPLLADDDVRLVWYADAVDARDTARTCASAARAGATDDPAIGAVRLLAVAAGELLGDVDLGAGGDAVELRALAGDLRWLADAGARCAAQQRLDTAVARALREQRPIVVVAHSFGALVTWGSLAGAPPAARVERLVTVGSMLGSGDVRALVFGDDRPLALPAGVRSWVNVVDDADGLAVPLGAATGAMRDVRVQSSRHDVHDFGGYLGDPVTARAVTEAWCAAFAGGAPAGCAAAARGTP